MRPTRTYDCEQCGEPVERPVRTDRRKLHTACVGAWWAAKVFPLRPDVAAATLPPDDPGERIGGERQP